MIIKMCENVKPTEININMRCIEINIVVLSKTLRIQININMRCIEILKADIILMQQHRLTLT